MLNIDIEDITEIEQPSLFRPQSILNALGSNKNSFSLKEQIKYHKTLADDQKIEKIEWIRNMLFIAWRKNLSKDLKNSIKNNVEITIHECLENCRDIKLDQNLGIDCSEISTILELDYTWMMKSKHFSEKIIQRAKMIEIHESKTFFSSYAIANSPLLIANILLSESSPIKVIEKLKALNLYEEFAKTIGPGMRGEYHGFEIQGHIDDRRKKDEIRVEELLSSFSMTSDKGLKQNIIRAVSTSEDLRLKSAILIFENPSYTNSIFTLEENHGIAQTLSCIPILLEKLIKGFAKKGVISTTPSPLLTDTIHVNHPLYCVKRVKSFPTSSFKRDFAVKLADAYSKGIVEIKLDCYSDHEYVANNRLKGLNALYGDNIEKESVKITTKIKTKASKHKRAKKIISMAEKITEILVKLVPDPMGIHKQQIMEIASILETKYIGDLIIKGVLIKKLEAASMYAATFSNDFFSDIVCRPFAHFISPHRAIYSWAGVEEYSKNIVYSFTVTDRVELSILQGPVTIGNISFKKEISDDFEYYYTSFNILDFLILEDQDELRKQFERNLPTIIAVYLDSPRAPIFSSLLKTFVKNYMLKMIISERYTPLFFEENPEVCENVFNFVTRKENNISSIRKNMIIRESYAKYVQWPLFEFLSLWDFDQDQCGFEFKRDYLMSNISPRKQARVATQVLQNYLTIMGFFEHDLLKGISPIVPILIGMDRDEVLQIEKELKDNSTLQELLGRDNYSKIQPYLRMHPINEHFILHPQNAMLMLSDYKEFEDLKLFLLQKKFLQYDLLRHESDIISRDFSEAALESSKALKSALDEIRSIPKSQSGVRKISYLLTQMLSPLFTLEMLNHRREAAREKERFNGYLYNTFQGRSILGLTLEAEIINDLKVIIKGSLVGIVNNKTFPNVKMKSLLRMEKITVNITEVNFMQRRVECVAETRPRNSWIEGFLSSNRVLEDYSLELGKTFLINSSQDIDKLDISQLKERTFSKRKIAHDSFYNIGTEDLASYMYTTDFLFRPDGFEIGKFILSWKVNNTILHNEKLTQDSNGTFEVGGKTFKSFDDIKKGYIDLKLILLAKAKSSEHYRECTEFSPEMFSTPESRMLINCNKQYPGKLTLAYIRDGNIVQELIDIEPLFYKFHNQEFDSIETCLRFANFNYQSIAYREAGQFISEKNCQEEVTVGEEDEILSKFMDPSRALGKREKNDQNNSQRPKKRIKNSNKLERESELDPSNPFSRANVNGWGVSDNILDLTDTNTPSKEVPSNKEIAINSWGTTEKNNKLPEPHTTNEGLSNTWGVQATPKEIETSWGATENKCLEPNDSWGDSLKKSSNGANSWGLPLSHDPKNDSWTTPDKKSAKKDSWGFNTPKASGNRLQDTNIDNASNDNLWGIPINASKDATPKADSWGVPPTKRIEQRNGDDYWHNGVGGSQEWGNSSNKERINISAPDKNKGSSGWGSSNKIQKKNENNSNRWGSLSSHHQNIESKDNWGSRNKSPRPQHSGNHNWGSRNKSPRPSNSGVDNWGSRSGSRGENKSKNGNWGRNKSPRPSDSTQNNCRSRSRSPIPQGVQQNSSDWSSSKPSSSPKLDPKIDSNLQSLIATTSRASRYEKMSKSKEQTGGSVATQSQIVLDKNLQNIMSSISTNKKKGRYDR